MTRFHDHVSAGQVLQKFLQRLPAIERIRDLIRVRARQLEKRYGCQRRESRPACPGILIEELVRRNDRDAELSSLAQDRVDFAAVRYRILYLVRVDREKGPRTASEQSIFHSREENRPERR